MTILFQPANLVQFSVRPFGLGLLDPSDSPSLPVILPAIVPATAIASTPASSTSQPCRHIVTIRGHRYSVQIITPGQHVRLFKDGCTDPHAPQSPGQPLVYDVAAQHGVVTCTCADYVFNREGRTTLPCKHGRVALDQGFIWTEDTNGQDGPDDDGDDSNDDNGSTSSTSATQMASVCPAPTDSDRAWRAAGRSAATQAARAAAHCLYVYRRYVDAVANPTTSATGRTTAFQATLTADRRFISAVSNLDDYDSAGADRLWDGTRAKVGEMEAEVAALEAERWEAYAALNEEVTAEMGEGAWNHDAWRDDPRGSTIGFAVDVDNFAFASSAEGGAR